ncbi:MAG TPA: hypothetical protein VF813_07705, partial [Anaerolineaceae bacterium]
YFLLPYKTPFTLDWEWLYRQPVIEETNFIRYVRLEEPLSIAVDGRKALGIMVKPEAKSA